MRKLPPAKIDDKPFGVGEALVGARQVVLLGQRMAKSPGIAHPGVAMIYRGGVVACGVDVEAPALKWATAVTEATPQNYQHITAAELTADSVVVCVRSLRNPLSVQAILVDRTAGAVLQRLPEDAGGGAVGIDRNRHRQIGAVGVAAGRLILEDAEGISVWGGKK